MSLPGRGTLLPRFRQRGCRSGLLGLRYTGQTSEVSLITTSTGRMLTSYQSPTHSLLSILPYSRYDSMHSCWRPRCRDEIEVSEANRPQSIVHQEVRQPDSMLVPLAHWVCRWLSPSPVNTSAWIALIVRRHDHSDRGTWLTSHRTRS